MYEGESCDWMKHRTQGGPKKRVMSLTKKSLMGLKENFNGLVELLLFGALSLQFGVVEPQNVN